MRESVGTVLANILIMALRVVIICFCLRAASSISPAAVGFGDVPGQSDFALNLRAPVERSELDSVMALETGKHTAFLNEIDLDKQRLMQTEKNAIRSIVANEFDPLLRKLRGA